MRNFNEMTDSEFDNWVKDMELNKVIENEQNFIHRFEIGNEWIEYKEENGILLLRQSKREWQKVKGHESMSSIIKTMFEINSKEMKYLKILESDSDNVFKLDESRRKKAVIPKIGEQLCRVIDLNHYRTTKEIIDYSPERKAS